MHPRVGWILLAAAAWNVWVWVTRLAIMVRDGELHSTGFVTVHTLLFTVSLLSAIVVGVVGWRIVRQGQR